MRTTSLAALGLWACSTTGPAGPFPAAHQTASFAPLGAAVLASATRYDALVAEPAPPMSLTSSDGAGLELVRLEGKVVIDGPLAFTELHLRFKNPEDRVREGRFAITLPPGAAISRFAMSIDGRWMEAEMVERMAARRAYEDALHRRQDPALLEKEAGNEFRARVFPIPARAEKDLIVSYSQELTASSGAYVLPLRGLPTVGEVAVSAMVARHDGADAAWERAELSQAQWKPDRDFSVEVSSQPGAVRSGNLLAFQVGPDLGFAGEAIEVPAAMTILFDTSASRALGFERQVAGLGEIIAALAASRGDLRITVAAFDQDIALIHDGAASAFGKAELDALIARQALGASDLGAALAWAKAHGAKDRVVVVSDAIVTAGDDAEGQSGAVRALGPAVERLDVVLSGGIKDTDLATALARGQLARDGAVLDLDGGAAEVARRLAMPTRSGLAIKVDGAAWVWPEHLDGVQPGDTALVYADLGAKSAGASTIAVSVGEHRMTVKPVTAVRPLVERALARAEIARLEAQLATMARGGAHRSSEMKALRQAITDRSIERRVLSDQTALLVLETEADYVRFGLDRRALADVLVVGARGVEAVQRTRPVLPVLPVLVTNTRLRANQPAKKDEGKSSQATGAARSAGPMDGVAPKEGSVGVDKNVPMDEGAGLITDTTRDPARASRELPTPAAEPVMTPSSGAALASESRPAAPPPPPPMPGPQRAQRQMRRPAADLGGALAGAGEERDGEGRDDDERQGVRSGPPPLEGELGKVMSLIGTKRVDEALVAAVRWRKENPGDILPLIALGEALEAKGAGKLAERAYGSIIDLFPARADLRRFAGERLERVAMRAKAGESSVSRLILDTYRRAAADRPDHLTGHRLYGYALVRAGRLADGFAAIERGLAQVYPSNRFAGGTEILREDLGIIGAAWLRQEPARAAELSKRLALVGATLATRPSLRFILNWETDANDVDFHIYDRHGGHAYYSDMQLPSGGRLYADVTTGYGPEMFAIDGAASAGPYRLQIHYYSKGPMGYGMGLLEVMRHDGKGGLHFEHRPFVVMVDGAFVDLGEVAGEARGSQIAR